MDSQLQTDTQVSCLKALSFESPQRKSSAKKRSQLQDYKENSIPLKLHALTDQFKEIQKSSMPNNESPCKSMKTEVSISSDSSRSLRPFAD